MKQKIRGRMDAIDALAMGDDQYYAMLKEMRILEKCYDRVLSSLPRDAQDTVCDFVSLCEEMSLRKLELACTYMKFPE